VSSNDQFALFADNHGSETNPTLFFNSDAPAHGFLLPGSRIISHLAAVIHHQYGMSAYDITHQVDTVSRRIDATPLQATTLFHNKERGTVAVRAANVQSDVACNCHIFSNAYVGRSGPGYMRGVVCPGSLTEGGEGISPHQPHCVQLISHARKPRQRIFVQYVAWVVNSDRFGIFIESIICHAT
jgi:hypothetical protein